MLVLLPFLVFPCIMSREMGLDPGVFGRFDLAALVQPHLKFLFVCLLVSRCHGMANVYTEAFVRTVGLDKAAFFM